MEETMSRKYDKRLKANVVYDICELGKSTSRTAKEYNIPLKTVEKWVTAYHKKALRSMKSVLFLMKKELVN